MERIRRLSGMVGSVCLCAALTGWLSSALVRADVPAGPPTFSDPTEITNEFFPFEPGAVKVFLGKGEDRERIVVVDLYLKKKRTFEWGGGEVECVTLQETEFEDGEILEISLNYFAQADNGCVYYFGEVVDMYEDGEVVDHEGSWLVGGPTRPSDPEETCDADDPAFFMPADPEKGDQWKPEDLLPCVDENAKVQAVDVRVKVAAGRFKEAIKVRETSGMPGEEDDVGWKWYAPGVGVVLDKNNAGEKLQLHASSLTD